MRYILHLSPDIIKLDRSLIAGLDIDRGQQALFQLREALLPDPFSVELRVHGLDSQPRLHELGKVLPGEDRGHRYPWRATLRIIPACLAGPTPHGQESAKRPGPGRCRQG